MSPQYGELRPTSGWDRFTSLGRPCKFQWLSGLGSITARQSSSDRQPNFLSWNRGRHLCSAGRPSRWALAHISSLIWYIQSCAFKLLLLSKHAISLSVYIVDHCLMIPWMIMSKFTVFFITASNNIEHCDFVSALSGRYVVSSSYCLQAR